MAVITPLLHHLHITEIGLSNRSLRSPTNHSKDFIYVHFFLSHPFLLALSACSFFSFVCSCVDDTEDTFWVVIIDSFDSSDGIDLVVKMKIAKRFIDWYYFIKLENKSKSKIQIKSKHPNLTSKLFKNPKLPFFKGSILLGLVLRNFALRLRIK